MKKFKKFSEERIGQLVGEDDKLYFDVIKIISDEGCVGNDYLFNKLKVDYSNMRDSELKLRIMGITSKINEKKAWGLQQIKDL
jgi:hypothetical protein